MRATPQTPPPVPHLSRVEVVSWVALVDTWMAPSCPARCPNIPERARLREALTKTRARGLVGVLDAGDRASVERANVLLHRYDAALSRFEWRGAAFVLAVVSSVFALAFAEMPEAWGLFTDALARVDRKILQALASGRAVFPEDYEVCHAAEAVFAYVRDGDEAAFAPWSQPQPSAPSTARAAEAA